MNAILRSGVGLVTLAILLSGCGRSSEKTGEVQKSTKKADAAEQTVNPAKSGIAGGLSWDIPSEWDIGEAGQMRVATYIIPPAAGDSDSAECAVFHFSGGQGGNVQANIDRWIGQMEQPDGSSSSAKAQISSTRINGLEITTLDIGGTYRVSAGPMMQVREKKPRYRMIGVVAKGPQGPVFFKLTGPERTVESNRKAFFTMINSISTN